MAARDVPARRWLEVGQTLLFVGLLSVADVRAALAGATWPVHAAAAAELLLFVVGLIVHRRIGRTGRALWVVALLAGAVGLSFASPDFVWVAFPVWLIAGHLLPLPLTLMATAVSLAGIGVALGYRDPDAGAPLGPLIGALVAVGVARGVLRLEREAQEHRRLLDQVLAQQAEVAALSDEVARAQREAGVLAERTRLAQDIHDTLAQGFSSVVLLSRAGLREPDAARIRELLASIEATASANLAESRRVVYALAPVDPGGAGLAAPLRRLADELGAHTGAEVSLDIDPDLPRLSTPIEVALLRVAQGALANVRRHSDATRVTVTLSSAGGEVRLDVVDDGRGFDLDAATGPPTLAGGYGLRALRERLDALGGGLSVESEPGRGTALSAHVPARREEATR